MKEIAYASVLADRIQDYLKFRRSLGYELRTQVYILRKLDAVLEQEMTTPGPVTHEMVEAFLSRLAGLRPLTRRMQLSVIRQFLRYLKQFEPDTYIPGRLLEQARATPRAPYIYTENEIQRLLKAAREYPRRYSSRRWALYPTLIAFLYATGMRISEALALNIEDIDWRSRVIRIPKTKFHKARLVPLATSTCDGLKRYLVARAERGHPTTGTSPLFVNEKRGRLSYSSALGSFRSIARLAGLPHSRERNPRLHDLRHTAAVARLYLWYREKRDVPSLLPVLVTYLGHTAVRCTQIYLTTTAELLAEASDRFERSFDIEKGAQA